MYRSPYFRSDEQASPHIDLARCSRNLLWRWILPYALNGGASCLNLLMDCLQTWRRICEASRNEFDAIYQRLGVHILWRGESFYNPVLKSLVEELIERGIAEDSDGAQVTSHPLQAPTRTTASRRRPLCELCLRLWSPAVA